MRDLLKKIKEKNNKNNKGGGANGPGWDWDGNKASLNNDEQDNSNQSEFSGEDLVQAGIGVTVIGAIGYGVYRVIRLIPSFVPGLWWTLPANIAIP